MGNYWRIFAEEVPSDMGIHLTPEQIDYLTNALEGAHENYSMAHGHDCIPNPMTVENARLEKALKEERDMVFCIPCQGTGRLQYNVGSWGVNTTCDKCRGKGKTQ